MDYSSTFNIGDQIQEGDTVYVVSKVFDKSKVKIQPIVRILSKDGFPTLRVPVHAGKGYHITYHAFTENEQRFYVPEMKGIWRSGKKDFYFVVPSNSL